MKNIFVSIGLVLTCIAYGQWYEGVWQLEDLNHKKVMDQVVLAMIQDDYLLMNARNQNHEFLYTWGGPIQITKNKLKILVDFNSKNPKEVGKTKYFDIDINENTISLINENERLTWSFKSNHKDELTGNKVFTGREKDGEMSRTTPGDRRTLKMLTGNHFQWVAFNSATGEFSGTGGGTYTAIDGAYTEKIEFFSRDNSRVGAVLTFNYQIMDDDWHHKGKSSKGEPLYEIWSTYEKYVKP
ncbi:MAG: hypothetical protein Q4G27_01180 [Flavobacteriaceae bacterium]|nr:hypothetical protein [Flavobacteriaceae bacterium]